LNGELESLQEAISRTNSRIVQSPDRIKKTITTLSHTTQEDKKMVALNEAKARDLNIKITALLNIEKVR
jgi:kinetochore protein Nuf2